MYDDDCTFFQLPEEVFIHILYFLTRKELLLSISPVCSYFRVLALNDKLWFHHTFVENSYYTCTSIKNDNITTTTSNIYDVSLLPSHDRLFHYEHLNNETKGIRFNPVAYYLEQLMVEKSCNDVTQQYFLEDKKTIESLEACDMSEVDDSGTDDVDKARYSNRLPGKRHRHTMTSCVTRKIPRYPDLPFNHMANRDIVLMGGFSSASTDTCPAEKEVFIFDSEAELFHNKPIDRKPYWIGKHSAVLHSEKDEKAGKLLMFGGTIVNDSVTNKVFEYDIHNDEVSEIEPSDHFAVPDPRCNHRSVVIGDEVFVIGGAIGQQLIPTADVFAYHLKTNSWRRVPVKNPEAFSPRLGFVMLKFDRKIIVYGGAFWQQTTSMYGTWKEKYTDTYIFDTETCIWTKLQTTGDRPEASSFPTSTLIGTMLYVISGSKKMNVAKDIYVLDLVRYHWMKMETVTNYDADGLNCQQYQKRISPQLFENKLLVFGGYRYNPLGHFKVFSIKWKDILDRLQLRSITFPEADKYEIVSSH
jgi:hypothetical protein